MKNPLSVISHYIARRSEPPRSPHWPSVRAAHLRREAWCRQCGGTQDLEVHHIAPFHLHPELELVEANLITLCERLGSECHLHRGHLGNWKCFNPQVRAEATHPAPMFVRGAPPHPPPAAPLRPGRIP